MSLTSRQIEFLEKLTKLENPVLRFAKQGVVGFTLSAEMMAAEKVNARMANAVINNQFLVKKFSSLACDQYELTEDAEKLAVLESLINRPAKTISDITALLQKQHVEHFEEQRGEAYNIRLFAEVAIRTGIKYLRVHDGEGNDANLVMTKFSDRTLREWRKLLDEAKGKIAEKRRKPS